VDRKELQSKAQSNDINRENQRHEKNAEGRGPAGVERKKKQTTEMEEKDRLDKVGALSGLWSFMHRMPY